MALSSGELGPIYGAAWRRWPKADGGHVDQIADLVAGIEAVKRDPTDSRGRRLLVMAWDPRQLDKVALPPCHIYHQYSVTNGRLSCMFGMRSSDSVLGLPYNVASYALLTHLLAKITGLQVGELVASLADVHIYTNHLDLVYEQLSREPRSLPRLSISDDVRTLEDLSSLTYDQVRLADYNPWPALKGEVAV
jgi:thymidylate synthase